MLGTKKHHPVRTWARLQKASRPCRGWRTSNCGSCKSYVFRRGCWLTEPLSERRVGMWERPPTIDLAGFERLHVLERRIYYSPTAIVLALVGIAGCVYWFWSLRRGLDAFRRDFFIAYGLFLASYLGTLAYLYGYRFRRLRCPGCDQRMQEFTADMDEGGWRRLVRA